MSARIAWRVGASPRRWIGMTGKSWSIAHTSGSDWNTREVAVVDVRERLLEAVQVRRGTCFTSWSLRTIAPTMLQKMLLGERQLAQADLAAREELPDLVAVVDRVVVALLEVARRDALQRVAQVADQLVLAVGARIGHRARLEPGDVEDVEEQDRVVRDGRATRLGDDHRVRDALRVEHAHDRLDHVDAVLVERVVAAVVEVRLRAVVVDREPAAEVEVAHRRALLLQVDVDSGTASSTPLRISRMFGICEPRW